MADVVSVPAHGTAQAPAFRVSPQDDGSRLVLTGDWTLLGLAQRTKALAQELQPYARDPGVRWDLTEIGALDSVGACMVWEINGRRRPARMDAQPQHQALLRRWEERKPPPQGRVAPQFDALGRLSGAARRGVDHVFSLVGLLGQVVLDLGHLVRHPLRTPWRELSATIYRAGVRALPVTAIVGFVVGVVMSYLGGLTLRGFGVESMIINLLGIGIVREVGPLLSAVLVAARSGSAITAGIGVMRVTQELDALSAMGSSATLLLVLPRVIGLMIAVPLLIIWTDAITLLGGMLETRLELDIGIGHLINALPGVVRPVDLWYGIVKGGIFGAVIGVIACSYGLRIKPNTENIGRATTNAVVLTITLVILIDAVAAVVFHGLGLQ